MRKATAFVDYTRAGPLMYLVVVAELDDDGEPFSVARVAEYPEKKTAQAHVQKMLAAIKFRPKTK